MGSPESPIEATGQSFPGMKVLLVEDNKMNQKLALKLLEKVSIQAALAENGQEALDLLSQEPFQLVLMDLQMPVLDGIEATRRIRLGENQIDPDTPVVAVTANVFDEDRKQCKAVGMNDFIAKPIERAHLYRVLHQFYTDSKSSN